MKKLLENGIILDAKCVQNWKRKVEAEQAMYEKEVEKNWKRKVEAEQAKYALKATGNILMLFISWLVINFIKFV